MANEGAVLPEIPIGDASTQSTGQVLVFVDSADKHIKTIDDAGTVEDLSATGGASQAGYVRFASVVYLFSTAVQIGDTGETSICRDSTDSFNIDWSGLLMAVITTSGAGGLDTGSEAASTWYAVHVIADTSEVNPPAAMLSLSATAPTMPSGYDVFRRLGWTRNDASSNILRFSQTGADNDRTYMYDSASTIVALSGGTALTWTAVSLSAGIPPTARWAWLRMNFDNAGTPNRDFGLRPSDFINATRTTAPQYWRPAAVASEEARKMDWCPCDPSQSLDYIMSSSLASLDLLINGFRDQI